MQGYILPKSSVHGLNDYTLLHRTNHFVNQALYFPNQTLALNSIIQQHRYITHKPRRGRQSTAMMSAITFSWSIHRFENQRPVACLKSLHFWTHCLGSLEPCFISSDFLLLFTNLIFLSPAQDHESKIHNITPNELYTVFGLECWWNLVIMIKKQLCLLRAWILQTIAKQNRSIQTRRHFQNLKMVS